MVLMPIISIHLSIEIPLLILQYPTVHFIDEGLSSGIVLCGVSAFGGVGVGVGVGVFGKNGDAAADAFGGV